MTTNWKIVKNNPEELLKVVSKPYQEVFREIIRSEVKKATKYIGQELIIRVTKKTFDNNANNKGNMQITMTIGKPNYQEREFIKKCLIVNEPFPVKKVQVKLFNNKK